MDDYVTSRLSRERSVNMFSPEMFVTRSEHVCEGDGPCVICPMIPEEFQVKWYFYGFEGGETLLGIYESTATYLNTAAGWCHWAIAEIPETGSPGVVSLQYQSGQIHFFVDWGSGFTGSIDIPGCPTGTITVPSEYVPNYIELVFWP